MCSARAVIMNTHAISSNRQTDTKSVLKSADTIVHGSSISAFRMSKSSSYQRDTDKIEETTFTISSSIHYTHAGATEIVLPTNPEKYEKCNQVPERHSEC